MHLKKKKSTNHTKTDTGTGPTAKEHVENFIALNRTNLVTPILINVQVFNIRGVQPTSLTDSRKKDQRYKVLLNYTRNVS